MPRRRDGRPITEPAVDRVLTTPDILAQEERLQKLAERRFGAGGLDHQIEAIEGLTPAQAQLATAVAGERQLVLVLAVGPAGTGKTTALRPAVEQLRREGRTVFGVSPSAAAAEVLAVDTGVDADTLDKLLIEHRFDRPPDHRYDLPTGSTVLVDEAAMVSTPKLAELFDLAEERDWRLVLVGDPMQFSAVGRSGMFGHLVDSFDTIELDRVHRFNHPWEAKASLRLRRGDPTVVEDYDERGRLHGGTAMRMRGAAVNAWWEAIERGETASLMAPTNAAVVDLNNSAQWRRLDAGQLDRDGSTLEVGPYRLHIGDRVATRHNDRRLRTNRQLMVKNRDRWTIDAIHRDGSVTVTCRSGQVRLPKNYVAEHVELAYAETSHASQGRTVDRSFLFLDGPTGAAGIYVPMTRGRETNDVFVAIRGEETPVDVVSEALSRTWIDRPAIAIRDDLMPAVVDDCDGAPAKPMDARELRRSFGRVADLRGEIQRAELDRRREAEERASISRKQEAARQRLGQLQARLDAARRTAADLDRPLRRHRRRAEVTEARRQLERLPREIATTEAMIEQLDDAARPPAENSLAARYLAGQEVQRKNEIAALDRRLDEDAALRSVGDTDEVVLRHVGPMPSDGPTKELWLEVTGRLTQHRLAFEVAGSTLLGDKSRIYDDPAYAVSRHAASQALERLARAFGRQLAIEPPHRDHGLTR